MTRAGLIPVLAAPHLDPGAGRVELSLPEGLTVDEIVKAVLPAASDADRRQARVSLVTKRGAEVILPAYWHRVRPRSGVQVVIRIIAGKDALRSILSIVVSIAALIVAPWLGGMLAGTFGLGVATWTAIAGIGISLVGQLLINALIPPPKDEKPENRYTISGFRNRLDPGGAVPMVLGQVRYAPPFAARSWSEIVGDWQYIRALFVVGYGPIDTTDFRLGETSIAEYDDVEIEVRDGRPGDAPMSFFPTQIVEESVSTDLTRPLIRDGSGSVIGGNPTEEKPVVRTTGADASGASIILAWPGGLVRFNDKGNKYSHSVRVRIEQRLATAEEWQLVEELTITAAKLELFWRQYTWDFPSRGRWQVRLTMLTDETEDNKVQQKTTWAALQTIRPEYPLNFRHPLTLIALRIRATYQINGQLDNFSALASTLCLDWDHLTETWVERATSNPASLYRYALQSVANPRPVADAAIDLAALASWHDFCRIKGLTYNAAHDRTGSTLRDVLVEIAAAGRASPRHDGLRWSVTVDRPAELIVDHVSPRNSREFKASRRYFQPPHAVRVPFMDATNEYKPAERLVRWPGYDGEIDLTETMEFPGKVWPDEIWREARRRMYEAIHRPDSYQVMQDDVVRVATRGDTVALSHFVLDGIEAAARVRRVAGTIIQLDDVVTMQAGEDYGIRFRVFAEGETPDDTIGQSVIRQVSTAPGVSDALRLQGSGPSPQPGDLVHFGRLNQVDRHAVVRGIEAGDDMGWMIQLIDAAPQIDEVVDSEEPPIWSSRVGEEIDPNLLQPPTPRFTSIVSGVTGTETEGNVEYRITPGPGAIQTSRYKIAHKLQASSDWTEFTIPAAEGGGTILGYAQGNAIDIRALAISPMNIEGSWTGTVSLVVGEEDADVPQALGEDAVSITALMGGALVMIATGDDPATTQIQIYRSMNATLNRATDAVGSPLAVSPLSSFSVALGDTTRSSLLSDGGMDNPSAWDLDAGWDIGGSVATHTPGTEDAIGQAVSTEAGRWYRFGYGVAGRTDGTLTPRLTGGTVRPGTIVATDGIHVTRIQAVSGNNRVEWSASDAFDGSFDDAVVYVESAACLAQGNHYVWVEPLNSDDVPGPIAGPFSILIV